MLELKKILFFLSGITNGHSLTNLSCIAHKLFIVWASLVAQMVKNLPTMLETQVQSLGQEDPLEKGKATHSGILGLPLWLSW